MIVDGYDITDKFVYDSLPTVSPHGEDVLLGFIYVLRSNATSEWNHPNLHKIGHTTSTVLKRIRNAKTQSTYLFSDVTVVSTYKCFNVSSNHVEQVLHDFFTDVRLDIDLTDPSGNLYHPQEWFIVEIDILDEAVTLFMQEKLHLFFYDPRTNKIIAK